MTGIALYNRSVLFPFLSSAIRTGMDLYFLPDQ